jgi:hypothetical protein
MSNDHRSNRRQTVVERHATIISITVSLTEHLAVRCVLGHQANQMLRFHYLEIEMSRSVNDITEAHEC